MMVRSVRGELGRTLGGFAVPLLVLALVALWPPPVSGPEGGSSVSGRRGPIRPDTPYSLVKHLDRAGLVETPVPELLGQLSRVEPGRLIRTPVREAHGGVALDADPIRGRIGRGLVRITCPGDVSERVEVSWSIADEPPTARLLEGFVRYLPPEKRPERGGPVTKMPSAYVRWMRGDGESHAETSSAVIVGPRLVAGGTAGPKNVGEEMPGESGRSHELLGIGGQDRGQSSLGRWLPLSVPIPTLGARDGQPASGDDTDASRLELRLVCEALVGEVQFSDLTLRVDSPLRRLLREGAYRYLPSTEFTFPLEKMLRAGDMYRESLLALPPSRFGFDLILPPHPILELQTSCRALTASPAEEAVFCVQIEDRITGEARTLLETVRPASTDPEWQPHTIDLTAFADRPIRLILETTARRVGEGPAPVASRDRSVPRVAPAWGTPVLLERSPSSPQRSVILLTIDCMREDRLGVHGAARPCTPVLDTLARRGVDFLNAYSTSHHTYIVLPMMMTGRMTRYDWIGSFNVIDPAVPSLPDILEDHGYLVAGFCDDYYYNGFWKGFPARPDLDRVDLFTHDRVLLRKASAFIRSHPGMPLFTWIHLRGPHPPCTGKPPADRFLVDEGLEALWKDLRRQAGIDEALPNWPAILNITRRVGELPESVVTQTVRIARALYDGSMFATDRLIGEFLNELEGAGVLDDTLLVVTSDHGIQLREDSLVGRGPREEGMRVPLILAGPGLTETPRRISRRVSTIAVMPTILDYLGLDPSRLVPGGPTETSLLPLCRGQDGGAERPVFGLFSALAAVWFGDHKYEVSQTFLNSMLADQSRLDGPVDPGESLLRLTPDRGEEPVPLTEETRGLLLEARRILVDFWGSLDSRTARGVMNAELIEFFQRAGYMR